MTKNNHPKQVDASAAVDVGEDTGKWIKGLRCPACNSNGTIFVASGDYLTCSLDKCPNRNYADALKARESAIREEGSLNALHVKAQRIRIIELEGQLEAVQKAARVFKQLAEEE